MLTIIDGIAIVTMIEVLSQGIILWWVLRPYDRKKEAHAQLRAWA